jgi:ADP-heptose:LPS heptosyltransferase
VGFLFKDSKEFNYLFTNHKVSLPNYKMKRSERNLMLLDAIGLNTKNSFPEVFITPDDKKFIDEFFKKNNYSNKRPLIVVHPGSSSKTRYKRWSPNKYIKLADLLIEDYRSQVVFTWNGEEKKLVEEIKYKMKNNPIISHPEQTLSQLAELLKRCNLYIGGDTAPMHLAAMVGTPVLALFGPTDPVTNAPFGEIPYRIIRKELSCSPCRDRNCKKGDCMDKITTEEVFKNAREMLTVKKEK